MTDELNDLAFRMVVGLLFSSGEACRPYHRDADGLLQRLGGYEALRELVERLL